LELLIKLSESITKCLLLLRPLQLCTDDILSVIPKRRLELDGWITLIINNESVALNCEDTEHENIWRLRLNLAVQNLANAIVLVFVMCNFIHAHSDMIISTENDEVLINRMLKSEAICSRLLITEFVNFNTEKMKLVRSAVCFPVPEMPELPKEMLKISSCGVLHNFAVIPPKTIPELMSCDFKPSKFDDKDAFELEECITKCMGYIKCVPEMCIFS